MITYIERIKLYCVRLYYRLVGDANIVFLESGWPVRVRRLALYELDNVKYDDPGPFLYTYKTNSGKIIERVYDLAQWTEIPKAPLTPEHECEKDSMDAGLWHVYSTYQAALAHRLKEIKAGEDYARDVGIYILDHCISQADRSRLKTPGDYERVYQAAINPEVAMEEIESVLDSTFPGFVRLQAHINESFRRQAEKLQQGGRSPVVGRADAAGVDAGQVEMGNAAM